MSLVLAFVAALPSISLVLAPNKLFVCCFVYLAFFMNHQYLPQLPGGFVAVFDP